MKPSPYRLAGAGAAIIIAISAAVFPHQNITRNVSASLDVGWYVRIPWAEPKPGSIVMFAIPERARGIAEKGKMNLNLPLMKRVEAVTPDGRLIVKGDCGGARSLDSRYFGAIDRADIEGVYTPLPWTLTSCRRGDGWQEKDGKEVYRKESSGSEIKRVSRNESAAFDKQPFTSTAYPSRKPLRDFAGPYRKLAGA